MDSTVSAGLKALVLNFEVKAGAVSLTSAVGCSTGAASCLRVAPSSRARSSEVYSGGNTIQSSQMSTTAVICFLNVSAVMRPGKEW